MSLNNISLPASLVSDLYSSVLVEDIAAKKSIPWKYLGRNKKNILLLVNYSDVPYIPDKQLEFLTGILSACKLTLEDVALVNLHHHAGSSFTECANQIPCKTVLLFGTEPTSFGLPISFPPFQVQPFADYTFLYIPALEEIETDKLLKSKLWVCLKRIFQI
jgi:hypothetical protein